MTLLSSLSLHVEIYAGNKTKSLAKFDLSKSFPGFPIGSLQRYISQVSA